MPGCIAENSTAKKTLLFIILIKEYYDYMGWSHLKDGWIHSIASFYFSHALKKATVMVA